MAKAMIEPEEVRQFAMRYKKFNDEMRQQLSRMNGDVGNLAQSWRDQEFGRFAQEFEEAIRPLGKFLEAGDAQVKFLVRKAQKAEEYLQQR